MVFFSSSSSFSARAALPTQRRFPIFVDHTLSPPPTVFASSSSSSTTLPPTNRSIGGQRLFVLVVGHAAEEDGRLDWRLKELAEALVLARNLVGQLAGVAQHQHANLALFRLQLLQRGNDKDGCLAHAGLGLADDVAAQHCRRDALLLD